MGGNYLNKLKKTILKLRGGELPDVLKTIEVNNKIQVILQQKNKFKYIIIVEPNVFKGSVNHTFKKSVYDLKSGILLEEVYDTMVSFNTFYHLKRQIINLVIEVKD